MTREEKIDKLIDLLAELGLIVIIDEPPGTVTPPDDLADNAKTLHTS